MLGAPHIRTHHYAHRTNGVEGGLSQSLKHEHLNQRETDHATALAGETKAFPTPFNEVEPHESRG